MNRKQLVSILIIAFFVGALGSIVFTRFLFPALSNVHGFGFLTNFTSSSPIVINRHEEVQLNEGVNLIDLVKQSSNITVSIFTKTNPKFLGNGVVITSDGLIFTTTEVVSGNPAVQVVLNDGSVHEGLVRATDPKSDLAIVTISTSNLAVAQFDNSATLAPGQRVFALGQASVAFNRDFASGFVTSNLTSAPSLDQVFSSESFGETIRTDMSLTSNLTGGPVMNLNGHVVGLVDGGKILVAEDLQSALTSYLASGKIVRPSFGVHYLNLSASLAALKSLPQRGALIVSIDKGSPADKAGLLANDLIVSADGQNLDKTSLEQVLNTHALGDMKVSIIRAGKPQDLTVTLIAK